MDKNTRTNVIPNSIDWFGGFVDDLFMTIGGTLTPFQPKRAVTRDQFIAEIDFYFKRGYINRPETLFSLPDTVPDPQLISERPYADGIREIYAFPSRYTPLHPMVENRFNAFVDNRTAYIVRWSHGSRDRKTVVCLHGYMLGDPVQAERMFKVRSLYDRGLDVALFITPFHWKRAPQQKMLRGIFLQPRDAAMTCECFGQAMHDLHLSLNLLSALGAGKIGLIGASLGGYLAGLYAALTDRMAFAALMVPAVKLTGLMPIGSGILPFAMDSALLEKTEQVWTIHSPVNFRPKLSKARILVIASRGDRLCPFAHVSELCAKWGITRHLFMTGGHWLTVNSRQRGRMWYQFLAEMGFIPPGQPAS